MVSITSMMSKYQELYGSRLCINLPLMEDIMEEAIELAKCKREYCQPEFTKVPSCCEPEEPDFVIRCQCGKESQLSSPDKDYLAKEWNYDIKEQTGV